MRCSRVNLVLLRRNCCFFKKLFRTSNNSNIEIVKQVARKGAGGQGTHLSTQPSHPYVGRRSTYQQQLGSKQAHRPVSVVWHSRSVSCSVCLRATEMEINTTLWAHVARKGLATTLW